MPSTHHSSRITHHCYVLALAVGAAALPACKRDSTPPPIPVSEAGLAVVPVQPLEGVPDKAIIGPAASVEEAARPASGGGEGGVAVDLSSAEAAANSYATVLNAGQLAQLPGLLVPEQQEVATRVITAFTPVVEATTELKRAISEKFPDAQGASSANVPGVPWSGGLTIESVEVSPDDPDTATATMAGPNGVSKLVTLKHVDGQWRVQEAKLPSPDEVDQIVAMVEPLTQGMRDITARIDSGEIATIEQLGPEMMKLGQAAMQSAAAAGAQLEVSPSTPETPEPSGQGAAPAQPRERQRDAVDDVVSGPFLNRGN